jgi:hypothetical protein
MGTANSLAFKFDPLSATVRARLDDDPHISSPEIGKGRWFTFEISSSSDLHSALDWIRVAYKAAGKKNKSK